LRALALACLLAGCNAPVNDPGLHALTILPGAQFYHGALPVENGGPVVTTAALTRSFIIRGKVSRLFGSVPLDTGGILVGVPGDIGYWGFVPGARDPQTPDQLSFGNEFAISDQVALGPMMVSVMAVGTDGKVGPPTTLSLTVQDFPIPDSHLSISLDWDTNADLDLRVIEPSGYELWPKKVSNPGASGDYHDDGYLDADSNSSCNLDGRREENALWVKPPAPGVYLIRVDTFSLCGQSFANWRVRAVQDGNELLVIRGESLPSDTRFAHGPGAGVYAGYITVTP